MKRKSRTTRAHEGGRKRTGTVAKLPGGRYQVILTLDDGARKRLPPLPKGTTLAMAQEKAAAWAERALEIGLSSGHRRGRTPVSMFSTVDQYVDAVFERGLRRQDNEKARIVNHVLPVLKVRKVEHFRDITVKDCRAIVESLDAKISSGTMSAKTARCVWGLLKWICKQSSSSKVEEFRIRDDDPAASVAGPESCAKKARQWLYPEELAQLLASDATRLFVSEVFRWQRERAREDGLAKFRYGALVMQHRFGSSLNLNTHLHAVFPDGVFSRLAPSEVEFHELRPPAPGDLAVFRSIWTARSLAKSGRAPGC